MSNNQSSQAGPPVDVGWGAVLEIDTVVWVARGKSSKAPGGRRPQVRLGEQARRQMQAASDWVDEVVAGLADPLCGAPEAYYGINTGFGSLAGKATLSHEYETRVLMRNLLVSHAAGVREYFDEETVRAALLLRAHSLAQGYSGVRCLLVDKLVKMLNQGVYPAVPCMGSLGASGDLAPLSHLALILSKVPAPPKGKPAPELDTTSGEAFIAVTAPVEPSPDTYFHVTQERFGGRQTLWRRVSGEEAMQAAGGQIELRAKEGLALNNGTTFSCALAALSAHDALNLLDNAELALAMTLEGIRGFADPFFAEVHSVRPHPGAVESARLVRRYTEGSTLLDGSRSKRPLRSPPQDPYSIRCSPQVHGAVRDSLDFIRKTVEVELNATTDNPLIFMQLPRRYKSVSGGNFHGAPLAFVMDYLGIILTELGSISERRIFKMTDFATDEDFELPSFLIDDDVPAGLNSGLMIPQY
ncbi:MAG: aromatic amino acid ammonia-lyase, partial [Acidobacteriota bacterium]